MNRFKQKNTAFEQKIAKAREDGDILKPAQKGFTDVPKNVRIYKKSMK